VGKARLLQQWTGYCLIHDTSEQRALMMFGEGNNGKSVVCAVFDALLGADNISTVPLEHFGERFRLAGTLGKLVNLMAEVGEIDRIAEGQLKAFVVGDPMEFELKHKQPFRARPTARIMIATNNVPNFSDKSDGVWRRFLMLPFTIQIPEGERIRGMDKPEWWQASGELPGILNWALEGLHSLRASGAFTIPESSRKALEQHRLDCNPTRRFLLENYRQAEEVIAHEGASKRQVYERYTHWAKENNHRVLSSNTFGKEVRRAFPGVRDGKSRCIPRDNIYAGLLPISTGPEVG
jgi:P4 family phage/plasmid primase-like protien